MGCCLSRSRSRSQLESPNSPYPAGSADDSSRAIAVAIAPPASSSGPPAVAPAPSAPPSSSRRRRRDPGPLDQHINRPLRRHTWTTSRRSWTRAELARERTEFFDTRVTGRPEIWQTLHAALQILWESPPEDASSPPNANDASAAGLATAQSLLEAAEISLPTGNLVNGAYDAFGNLYPLPEFIVSDPEDVLNGEDKKQHIAAAGDGAVGEDQDDDYDDDDDDDEEEREDGYARDGGPEVENLDGGKRRLEKGKGLVDADERETVMVSLRARLSDTGRDTLVKIQASEKVKSVIRKISTKTNLASNKRIRIAYMGKMLKENASLEAQGWKTGHVVNAMVFNR